MARGEFNIWIPSNDSWEKFDWVPTTSWESSDLADDVLVRLGLTNGRGITNIFNRFVKPIIKKNFAQIWNVAGGFLGALSGGILPVGSFSAVLNNGMTNLLKMQGIDSVKNTGLKIYVSVDDIQQIVNAIRPIVTAENYHHSILMKRLHEGMIYRLEKLKTMEFESSEGKSALIHVLAIQSIIKRGIFDSSGSNFFNSGDVAICASEDYQKFVFGLINPKFSRKDVKEICNFLATFRYTDDLAEYNDFERQLDDYQNAQIVSSTVSSGALDTRLIIGVGAAIGAAMLYKGGK